MPEHVYLLMVHHRGTRPVALPFSSLERLKSHACDLVIHNLHEFKPSKEKNELLFALESRDHDKSLGLWRKLHRPELFDMWWDERPAVVL